MENGFVAAACGTPAQSVGHRRKDGLRTLAGMVLERFDKIDERIGFGLTLYGMLFGCAPVHAGAAAFARSVTHTGSRADYWPQVFVPRKTAKSGMPPQGDAAAFPNAYSPPLERAWPDQPLPPPAAADWFADHPSAFDYIAEPVPPRILDMTDEHLLGQRKWQAAAGLAGSLFPS